MGGVQSSSIKRIIFVNSRFNVFHLYHYVLIVSQISFCAGHAIGKSEKCQDFTFFHGWSAGLSSRLYLLLPLGGNILPRLEMMSRRICDFQEYSVAVISGLLSL